MDTLAQLKGLLQEKYGFDPESLDATTSFADYGVDSLARAELLFSVEEHFRIAFPNDRTDVDSLGELAKVIDFVRAKKA